MRVIGRRYLRKKGAVLMRVIAIVTDASIGRCAFLGCERLAKLTLPTALSRIDEYAFAHCSALVEFTLPTTLTSIGTWAFADCTALPARILASPPPPTVATP